MVDLNNTLLAEATQLENHWEQTGLLEGLEDSEIRKTTSVLLENQKLVNEAVVGGTDTSDVSVFRRISIPLVRRIYPQLIANKIVSVQPLLGPTGLVYYLRFRYGTDKGSTLGETNKDLTVGSAGAESITMQQQTDGDANLDIWYSHQRVNNEAITGINDGTAIQAVVEHAPVLNNQILFANNTEANANQAVEVGTTAGANPYIMWGTFDFTDVADDGDATAETYDFSISSTSAPILKLYDSSGNAYPNVNGTVGSISGSTITWAVTIDPVDNTNGTGASAINQISLDLNTGIFTFNFSDINATDTLSMNVTYEYDMECNGDLPEVNLVIESETITAKTRKLKAVWSFEAQQDLRSQHNIDAEAELTQILAKEINLEIDREIIGDLRNNAGTVATWDFATALGDTIKEKYEALYVKVTEISNIIHRKTLRGGANWLVTSPEVASIFETATAGFAPSPSSSFESTLGIQYIGTINGRWKIYKDPLFPRGSVLMGYRGDSYMDSGYFYCPYVPLTQTPVVLDPDSFCPRRGVLTRYGKKLLREGRRFYARISIQNFNI